MQVQDIMTAEVVTVEERTAFRDIVELLVQHEISSVPVIDRHGRLVGLVGESDLLSKEAFPEGRSRRAVSLIADVLGGVDVHWIVRADGLAAGDVMSLDPITVDPSTDVHTVARLMLEGAVSQMPVVAGDRLVGIVTRRDVLRTFLRGDTALAADVARELGRLEEELRHDVACEVADGAVTLRGTVRRREDAELLVRVVERVPGVVHVQDRLAVRGAGDRPSGEVGGHGRC